MLKKTRERNTKHFDVLHWDWGVYLRVCAMGTVHGKVFWKIRVTHSKLVKGNHLCKRREPEKDRRIGEGKNQPDEEEYKRRRKERRTFVFGD